MILGGAVLAVLVILVLVLSPFGSKDPDTAAKNPQTSEPAPARTTAVPAPSGGSIKKTVAPAPPAKTYANSKDGSVDIPGEVQVSLISVEKRKKPEAIGPGALADPVVVVTIELNNHGSEPIDLRGVTLTLLYGKNRVGTPVQSELGKPLVGSLKTGDSAKGSYVFSIPKKEISGSHTILVQSGAGKGIAKLRT